MIQPRIEVDIGVRRIHDSKSVKCEEQQCRHDIMTPAVLDMGLRIRIENKTDDELQDDDDAQAETDSVVERPEGEAELEQDENKYIDLYEYEEQIDIASDSFPEFRSHRIAALSLRV